jgi:pilus assembly protein CpaF
MEVKIGEFHGFPPPKIELSRIMTPCYDDFMENVSLNFGPIQPFLQDDTVSEIMVNRFDKIFIERAGKLQPTPMKFASDQALQELIQAIAKFSGRQINDSRPFMDGYLPDGSRVNASLPPMAPKGSTLTIRKFRRTPFTLQNYLELGSLSDKAAFFLHACVIARVNLVVSGGTGTGKTTFLNALSAIIPENERVISIEDVSELNLQQENWVRLESSYRPGVPPISTRDCLINALRMRPDRILVGECRRDETFEMLQAMNTGHEGSMTTVHANGSRDCLTRLESLILSSGVDIPLPALRKQIGGAIDLVVQLKRDKSGKRVVQEIVEITGMEQNTITTQATFTRDGKTDILATTGLVPSFMDKFAEAGIQFPQNFFDPNTRVTYRPD